jgi:hypothetical protein
MILPDNDFAEKSVRQNDPEFAQAYRISIVCNAEALCFSLHCKRSRSAHPAQRKETKIAKKKAPESARSSFLCGVEFVVSPNSLGL